MPCVNAQTVAANLAALRAKAPLVHNITNYVVMNSTANGLLAVGASPVMAHAPEEMEDLVGIAGSLVVNMGTLSKPWVDSMRLAMGFAAKRGIPVVFDPVGAGASRYRTDTARELAAKAGLIRGNASEILCLAADGAKTKGVDSADPAEAAVDAARGLARGSGRVVTVSGATDYIVTAGAVAAIGNGHPMMTRVTGTGCLASAMVAAFAAVEPDPFIASQSAMAVMGIAGELAAGRSKGPGSFWVEFLDALHGLDAATVAARLKAESR